MGCHLVHAQLATQQEELRQHNKHIQSLLRRIPSLDELLDFVSGTVELVENHRFRRCSQIAFYKFQGLCVRMRVRERMSSHMHRHGSLPSKLAGLQNANRA